MKRLKEAGSEWRGRRLFFSVSVQFNTRKRRKHVLLNARQFTRKLMKGKLHLSCRGRRFRNLNGVEK